MKLTRIEVRNFRSLSQVGGADPFVLELGEGMNALVGPNNCGKSNVLRAVAMALEPSWSFDRTRDRSVGTGGNYPRVTLEFTCDGKTSAEKTLLKRVEKYERSLLPTGKKSYAQEGLVYLTVMYLGDDPPSRQDSFVVRGVGARAGDPDLREKAVSQLRRALQFVMLESGQSLESMLTGRFREILHSVIRSHLKDEFQAAERKRLGFVEDLQGDLLAPLRGRIQGILTELFPEITEVSLVPSVPSIDETLSNVAVHLTDALPTALAAKGTGVRGAVLVAMLRYLAEYSNRSIVFAVEEPEAFLHPAAQEDLRDDLEGLAERPDITLLVTSHSPFVVSRDPKSKLVSLAKDAAGRTFVLGEARGPQTHFSLLGGLFRDAALPDILARAESLPPDARAVVLVEGTTDRDYLQIAAEKAKRPELLRGLHIVPAGGAEHLLVQAVLMKARTPVPVLAVLDNDAPGRSVREKLTGKFRFKKPKEVMHYGELADPKLPDPEAEDLFPPVLIQAFVETHGEPMVVSRKTFLGGTPPRYDLNAVGKELLPGFLREHATDADVPLWVKLLELIRERTEVDREEAPTVDLTSPPEGQADEAGEVGRRRADFFQRVMERVAEQVPDFRIPKASPHRHGIEFRHGAFGHFGLVFGRTDLRVEAYLDMRDGATTKRLFDGLHSRRGAIEAQFGEELSWERLDGAQASRIAVYGKQPNFGDTGDLDSVVHWASDRAIRFLSVLEDDLRSAARDGSRG